MKKIKISLFLLALLFLPCPVFVGNIYADDTLEDALYEQAYDDMNNGNDIQALINFQRVVLINPRNVNAQMFCGVTSHRLRYYANAVYYYQKAIDLSRGAFPTYLNLAKTYTEIGNDSLAFDYFARTKDSYSSAHKSVYTHSGYLFYRYARYDEAMSDYREAAQIDSSDYFICYHIAMVHERLSQLDSTRYYLDKSLKLFPKGVMPNLAKAEMLKDEGRPQPEISVFAKIAVSELSKSLTMDTNRRGYENYLLRAEAYRLMGNKEKMVADFKIAIEKLDYIIGLHPQAYGFISDRSFAYYYLGDKERALRDVKLALDINPQSVAARDNLKDIMAMP